MTHQEKPQTLVVDSLLKRYGSKTAVKGISFSLEPGEFVGFIGPNGAGKSTTMRCIIGLLNADGGKILVDGIDVEKDAVGARQRIGYVGQELELYRYLTGEELLRFVGSVRGMPDEEIDARVPELLELCDLERARGQLIREYSGGMARKIAIATALIGEPPLLLLDESFVGLDPESTYRIRKHLAKLAKRGATILLSSHVLDLLQRISTRVIVLHEGRVVADMDRDELARRFEEEGHADLTRVYLRLTDQASLMD